MFEQQFIVFKEVADTKNITLAAKRLHMSQPSISLQIQNLEGQYNTRFFNRTNKGVSLTKAGEVFYSHVCEILDILDKAQHQVSELDEERRGEIHLGATLTIGEYVLPNLLAYLSSKLPDVDFKVKIANTEVIDQDVIEGKIHIGLIEGPEPKGRGVIVDKFWEDELVVVVPHFHPWAEYDSIQLSELPYERFVTREVGSGTRKTMEMALVERGLDPAKLNIAMELGSTQAIKQVVCAGLGITIISALTVRKECAQGILKALRIQDDPVYRPLNILTLAKSSQTKYERTFINFLHNQKLLTEILTQNYCAEGMRYIDVARTACDK
ncbi:LysR family transcriptional regulator [Desulfitobacterium sp. THU1]|uniref:LysR family transcriptional regulator n=1 Tax=Desulfitobacterium sp. THU1 TaxID=3138072 RepID=UPI00311EDE8A